MVDILITLLSVDIKLFNLFNGTLSNPFFDFIMPILTRGTTWIVPLLLMAFFYWKKERKSALVIMLFSLILVGLSDLFTVRALKPLFERHRPCDPSFIVEGGRFLIGNLRSLSFPSAHAFNSAAFAGYFSIFVPNRKFLFIGISLLIGFTRVYVGVHYPGDVLFGWIIGAGMGISYALLMRNLFRIAKKRSA